MIYKEIDRDLLIRKRRIAFELGESTLPKYAKKFIERVLDSEELTPTLSESEIRADERAKTIGEIEDIVDEINNQGFHCIDDYCDDDNHDCAECMAKAILGSLARMKSNAEYEREQKNDNFQKNC